MRSGARRYRRESPTRMMLPRPSLPSQASGPVTYPVADFYLTNAICRASPTMQRCSAELLHGEDYAEAAE